MLHTTTLTLRYSYAFTCNPRSVFPPSPRSSSFSTFSPFFSFPFALVFLPARFLSLISVHYQHRCRYLQRVPLSNVSFTRIHVAYHKRAGHVIFIFANMIHLRVIITCQRRGAILPPTALSLTDVFLFFFTIALGSKRERKKGRERMRGRVRDTGYYSNYSQPAVQLTGSTFDERHFGISLRSHAYMRLSLSLVAPRTV